MNSPLIMCTTFEMFCAQYPQVTVETAESDAIWQLLWSDYRKKKQLCHDKWHFPKFTYGLLVQAMIERTFICSVSSNL